MAKAKTKGAKGGGTRGGGGPAKGLKLGKIVESVRRRSAGGARFGSG